MTEIESEPDEINPYPVVKSVEDFINSFAKKQLKIDSFMLLEIMQKAVGEPPKMWGSTLIGFGKVRIKSPTTGREVDWLRIGFSPRVEDISIYFGGSFIQKHGDVLARLGKYKISHGCVYIKKLMDIDINVLKEMIDTALKMDFFYK